MAASAAGPNATPGLSSSADNGLGNALYIAVTITAVEISLVDHTPEEILVATATGLSLEYAAGIGPDCCFTSMRLSVNGVQIDDQLATSRFPVVLTAASVESEEGGVAQPLVQGCLICQPTGAQGQVGVCMLSPCRVGLTSFCFCHCWMHAHCVGQEEMPAAVPHKTAQPLPLLL